MKRKVTVNKWKVENSDPVYYLTIENGKELVDETLCDDFNNVMNLFRKSILGIHESEWKLKISWEVDKK